MLFTILFCLALAVSLWIWPIVIFRFIRGETIYAWQFIVQAISLTAVITHIIGIWQGE